MAKTTRARDRGQPRGVGRRSGEVLRGIGYRPAERWACSSIRKESVATSGATFDVSRELTEAGETSTGALSAPSGAAANRWLCRVSLLIAVACSEIQILELASGLHCLMPMSRFLQLVCGLCVASVILLQPSGVCWAAETTERGVTATLYAGTGGLSVGNNEGTPPNEFAVRRAGVGLLAVARFSSAGAPMPAATGSPPSRSAGFFVMAGGTTELEWLKVNRCGFSCDYVGPSGSEAQAFQRGHALGWRLGAGYSFGNLEFRVGALQTRPSSGRVGGDPLLLPDVMLRLGRRSLGWFELGLGEYDASTTLRPGVYIGGGGFPIEQLRISGHVGIHLMQGDCCSVPLVGAILDLGLDHAFSRALVSGIDVKLDGDTLEGGAHLSWLL